MSEEFRAVKKNIPLLPGIAAFNDDFRDALRGNHSNKKTRGFISGLGFREEAVKFGIVGSVNHPQIVYGYVDTSKKPWANSPDQCINYVSCHDNYTLWDKLKQSSPKVSDEDLRKMVMLAGALLLTSQGVPFLHSGMEFCRSKGGHGNSYKSSDSVNQIDWARKAEYREVFEYYKKLIKLRKNHPALRMGDPGKIARYIHFCTEYKPGLAGYCINGEAAGDQWPYIVVIFNGNRENVEVPLPEGVFSMTAGNFEICEDGIGEPVTGKIEVKGISVVILVKKPDKETQT
jgi:pullulanase